MIQWEESVWILYDLSISVYSRCWKIFDNGCNADTAVIVLEKLDKLKRLF